MVRFECCNVSYTKQHKYSVKCSTHVHYKCRTDGPSMVQLVHGYVMETSFGTYCTCNSLKLQQMYMYLPFVMNLCVGTMKMFILYLHSVPLTLEVVGLQRRGRGEALGQWGLQGVNHVPTDPHLVLLLFKTKCVYSKGEQMMLGWVAAGPGGNFFKGLF